VKPGWWYWGGRAEPLKGVLFPKSCGLEPSRSPLSLCPVPGLGAVLGGGRRARYPARSRGASAEGGSSLPWGWRSLPPACSAHLLPGFRAGSCLYEQGSLLAENHKVWGSWARRGALSRRRLRSCEKISLKVRLKFVTHRFCTTGKLGLCILINTFAQAITHLWPVIPTVSQGKTSFGHFCFKQLCGKTCLGNQIILHSSYLC